MNTNNSSNQQASSINSASHLIDAKLEEHQMCGSKHCPGCGHKLESKPDWLGLPAGVKFDPTDQELIEHLEAKVETKNDMKSHPLIDEFIPTIEGEDGICYTHPEKLPGVTRDGLSRHFFHRPSKAYTTGTRKRRKIQTECDLTGGETRWHKTGKTRAVMVNGKQKGCKKILVLYTNFGKHRKPEKTNWVMHQYHLGTSEEEKDGELVVSKIFYQTQPRQCSWSDRTLLLSAAAAAAAAAASSEGSGAAAEAVGGGSCSSKEMLIGQRGDLPGLPATYTAVDIQQLKSDHFGFDPFRRSFDDAGAGEASAAPPGECGPARPSGGMCEEHVQRRPHHVTHESQMPQHHHQHINATAAFHVSRPSLPISTVISPSPLHHTSIILDEDSYHRIMLQNENFQGEQEQQQHHHKMGGRSASGLEEVIMGCTSTDMKGESTMTNPQDAEWLKYSFWPEPDNSDHHA